VLSQALSAFLASQPHITSLRLQGVEITAKEADELCRGLKAIRHITFCDNSIGLSEDGLESLVALLLCCELLESTSIIRNSLSDKHVPQILSLLQHHATLTTISLSWNGISDRGAVKLAEALSVLKSSLKHIDLSCNFIGATGGDALMRAVGRRRDLLGHDCAPLRISFDRLPSASRSLPFALRGAAHRVGEVDAFSSCTQSRQNYARLASHYL
jgi:Ran GTPase-activating protein (RanGAP) involved in mRNA processing and transport